MSAEMIKMLEIAGDGVVGLLILSGAVLSALSAFGMIRFPDVYLRAHAASKSATLGVLCILTGAFLHFLFHEGQADIKLILGILFVFLTSPIAGHLNGRAAYRSGVPMWGKSVRDDLGKALDKGRQAAKERGEAE